MMFPVYNCIFFSSLNAVLIYMTPFRGWNWFRTEFMRLVSTVIRSRNVGRQMAVVETWMEVRRLAFPGQTGPLPWSHRSPQTAPYTPGVCGLPTEPWWRHQMGTFSAVRGIHRPPADSPHKGQWRGALMFSLICLHKRLSKQSRRGWFETPLRSLWRHCNDSTNDSAVPSCSQKKRCSSLIRARYKVSCVFNLCFIFCFTHHDRWCLKYTLYWAALHRPLTCI